MDTIKLLGYFTILGVTVYVAGYITHKIMDEISQEVE